MDERIDLHKIRFLHTLPTEERIKVIAAIDGGESQARIRDDMQRAVNAATHFLDSNEWVKVEADRVGSKITLRWEPAQSYMKPSEFRVHGLMRELCFVPSLGNIAEKLILEGNGQGTMTLELEQGRCYCIGFIIGRNEIQNVKGLLLEIAVPLSDDNRRILNDAIRNNGLAERLTSDLKRFREAQDAFEEMCRSEIAKIKAKRLPPEDEQQHIDDFRDYAASVRVKYNL